MVSSWIILKVTTHVKNVWLVNKKVEALYLKYGPSS